MYYHEILGILLFYVPRMFNAGVKLYRRFSCFIKQLRAKLA